MSNRMAKRVRFSVSDDIILLQHVLAENPFEDVSKFEIIRRNLNSETKKNFSARAIKEHVQLLLKTRNHNKQKKSATEEEWSSLQILSKKVSDLSKSLNQTEPITNVEEECSSESQLLVKEEVRDESLKNVLLCESFGDNLLFDGVKNDRSLEVEVPLMKCEINYTNGDEDDDSDAISGHQPTSLESAPVSKNYDSTSIQPASLRICTSTNTRNNCRCAIQKRKFDAVIELIQEKHRKEGEMHAKKLKLEEETLLLEREKLQFEKNKFQFERKEREARLQIEIEERRERLAADKEQREMLLSLMKMILEKNHAEKSPVLS